MAQDQQAGFTLEDVTYHTPAGVPLLARLYRPAGKGPFPAVVDVHGGRWCAETRLTNAPIDEALAAAGIFVMALDFRMPPVAQYPLPVADINFAIRWLHAHAKEFNVRPDWIGGVGTSSGGHQLMLNVLEPAAFNDDHLADMAKVPAKLNYVIFGWPVSDPPARYAYAIERKMDIHIESHRAYWPSEAAMAEGSPQRIVADGHKRVLPPAQIIQGDADVILVPGMSRRFADAWQAAGGEVDFESFAGEGHTFITKTPESDASRDALAKMIRFIRRHTSGA